MEILFAATELAPTVKVGGLADVVFALSKTLKNMGHRVTIAMPRYPAFERAGILAARRLTPLKLPPPGGITASSEVSGFPREVMLFDSRLPSGVELLLIDALGADGASVFGEVLDPAGDGVYEKDGVARPVAPLRSAVLCRAIVELMRQRVANGQAFDVVQAHDWPTAMVPYLMRMHPELAVTRSVLTIHNLAHQGLFSGAPAREALAAFGLGEDHFTPARLEFYGGLSLLKGGILAADAITTVSGTYAKEILTPEGGERLDGVLRARKDGVLGILNGLDYAVWNPAIDPALVAHYDADDPSHKGRSKTTLLAETGLELDPARPLFVSLGRIVSQKGADLLARALPRLLKQDLSLLIAGTGDPAIEQALAAAVLRAPERAKLLGRVSENDAHRLMAAADFVLLPSRFEPCGLVQVQAQRYGALPIATRTGGFVDTIVDLDAHLESGTGFLMPEQSIEAIVGGVGRALAAYAHPRFGALRRRVMRLDVSWDRPARRYAQLFRQLTQPGSPDKGATAPAAPAG